MEQQESQKSDDASENSFTPSTVKTEPEEAKKMPSGSGGGS